MAKKRKVYETIHNKFNETLGKKIITRNHRGRRVEKAYKAANHLSNGWIHFGELCLALVFMTTTYLFGNGDNLPNNTTLVYPLYEVSKLECRTQEFSTLSSSCKIELPIIHGADYTTYENEKIYKDIYTVLRWGTYTNQRDQGSGAHYAVDIASSKGTPLYAIADGEVYSATYNTAYGNVVKIKFKYKDEILYAVYAHMDSYTVKAGDLVKKGQQIGKVGNSGNVSGALGGYHVHFEIDKDAGGRPAYAFNGCAETAKGHYEIIQKGYCRVQLFQYTKDPIVLLEGANAKYPTLVWEQPEHPAPTEPIVPLPEEPVPPIPEPEIPALPDPLPQPEENKNVISLDFSKVDLVGREFLNKRDISIEKNFWEIVGMEDKMSFTMTIKNKVTGEPFHGTLNQPLLLVASNTNVTINPVSTVLVSKGTATMNLTPKNKGNVYIAINLWIAKIGGIILSIQ